MRAGWRVEFVPVRTRYRGERSKIRPRPANDLRREERYEVMNRMINHLFGRSSRGGLFRPAIAWSKTLRFRPAAFMHLHVFQRGAR